MKKVFDGQWDEMKSKVQEKWSKLTDDDLAYINGKRDQLVGRLKEKYGWEKDRVEKEIKTFEEAHGDASSVSPNSTAWSDTEVKSGKSHDHKHKKNAPRYQDRQQQTPDHNQDHGKEPHRNLNPGNRNKK